jgi:hypothetical protein
MMMVVPPRAGPVWDRRRHHSRCRPLAAAGHAGNGALGKLRASIEHRFATLKRWYGYRRVRGRSLLRSVLRLQRLAVAMSLRRALVLTG